MLWRLRLALLPLIFLFMLSIRPVSAHANLSRSEPAANASLQQSPSEIRLWFTEPLEADFSRITLRDSSGNLVTTPSSQVDGSLPMQMFMQPGELPDGLYTVAWRVVSVDGHSTEGSFSFGVRVAVTSAAALPMVDETIPVTSAAIRWFNFLSLSLASGSIAFWLFVWSPSVKESQPPVERRMAIVMWFGWLLVGVSGVMSLLLQVSIAAGLPIPEIISSSAIGELINSTRYGQIWLARQVFWIGLGAVLFFAHGARWLYWLALALCGQLILSNSMYSHASSVSEDTNLAIASDWLHLASTALWIGGLVQFANIIGPVRRSFSSPIPIMTSLVGNFSNFARIALAALVISGLYAAWLQVGSLDALLNTAYGQTLFVKLFLFLPLLILSGINFWFTRRGLEAGEVVWIRRLRGLVGAEIALAVGILAVVGVMTSIAPARTVTAVRDAEIPEPAAQPFFQMQQEENLMAHLEITPGYVGENNFIVSLFDPEGNPITDAALVRLRFDNLEQNLGQSELRPELQANGLYSVAGTNLSIPGQWRIRMTVQRPEQYDAVIDFEPQINPPPPPPAPVIDTEIPSSVRFFAVFITGLVLLVVGGFFAGQTYPNWLNGAGAMTTMVLGIGVLFLIGAVGIGVEMSSQDSEVTTTRVLSARRATTSTETSNSGVLSISNARSLPAPAGMTGSVFLTLDNGTNQPYRLIGAVTEVAESVQLHYTEIVDDFASMDRIESIDVPAGARVDVAPGGYHLMLADLKRDLSWGDSFQISLHFASGEQITTSVTIQSQESTEVK